MKISKIVSGNISMAVMPTILWACHYTADEYAGERADIYDGEYDGYCEFGIDAPLGRGDMPITDDLAYALYAHLCFIFKNVRMFHIKEAYYGGANKEYLTFLVGKPYDNYADAYDEQLLDGGVLHNEAVAWGDFEHGATTMFE